MKITLNLATRPYADHGPILRQLRIAMGVVAVAILGCVWGLQHLHHTALVVAAREAAADQTLARIRAEQQSLQAQMRTPQNARVLTQAAFLNAIFDEKSFSWTAVMEDLEPVLPAGVQVTAIEPSRDKTGVLTLHLRVAGLRERVIALVRNMEHSRRFSSPRITGENAESTGNSQTQQPNVNGLVSFDLLAEYNPTAAPESPASKHAANSLTSPSHNSPSGISTHHQTRSGNTAARKPAASALQPPAPPARHGGAQ